MKNADVHAALDEDLGYTNRVKQEILLVDEKTVSQSYLRFPASQPNKVKDNISVLLKKVVI